MSARGPWGGGSADVRGEGDSLKMLPAWSVVVAIAIFVGSMTFFNYTPSRPGPQGAQPQSQGQQAASGQAANAAPGQPANAASGQGAGAPRQAGTSGPQRRGPRPSPQVWRAWRLIFSYMTSAALASYVLLIGYVSRDVKRRNMSAPLWMLVVVVMPGGVGAVVYFLLRQPVMTRCPHCTTELTEGVHFCPQCRFQVAPVCGQCFRGVQITDAYCPQCGHDVAEDAAPARLRAYSDS